MAPSLFKHPFRAKAYLGLVVAAVALTPPTFLATAQRIPNIKAQGVAMPFYARGQPTAIAVLRIKRLFKDSRRVGFFKVRLLPMMACEEVHLEILRPEFASHLLDELDSGLQRLGGGQPIEFRQFKVTFPKEVPPRLQARKARPSEKGDALLLEEVTFGAANGPSISRASLRLRPEPGRVLATSGRQEIHFDLFTGSFATNQTTRKGVRQ